MKQVVMPTNLVELLRWRSHHQSQQRAYTFLADGESEEAHLSYGELDRHARAIATHLQSLTQPKERVLLLYPPGLEFISAFFACLYAGVVAVPVYPPRPNRSLSRFLSIAKDAQATVALTTSSILAKINPQQRIKDTPEVKLRHWLASETINPNLALKWQENLPNKDSLAFLQYTSGSTGKPKGVIVTHGNILHNSEYIKQAFELSSESVSVTWLPSFHDMGLIDGIIQPLYTGFPAIVMPPSSFIQKPIRWLQAISRYQATHSGGPNLGYQLCVDKVTPEQLESLDLRSWSSAYSGAEPVRRETLESFARKFQSSGFQSHFFYPCYGMAEATLMISGGKLTDEPIYLSVQADELEYDRVVTASSNTKKVRQLVGCGHAWLDTEIVIVDPQTRQKLPANRVGEIWVSGSSVTQGYWQQPEQTKETFQATIKDAEKGYFLRTGDLGFVRDEQLLITGRIKDLIIIWGRNHYPQDIEYIVQQSHPALRPDSGAAFVVEVENQERLAIAQEVERSYLKKLDVDEVVTTIRRVVSAEHELPVYAVSLLKTASLPKTSSGKVQRHACRHAFLNSSLNVVGEWRQTLAISEDEQGGLTSEVPLTKEVILDGLIKKLTVALGVHADEIDSKEPWANYGLDSSVALSLTGELEAWLGSELEPTLFWEYPNLESLTHYLCEVRQLV